jgi:hypothetical protein
MPTAEEIFEPKPSQPNSDADADPSPAMELADREIVRLGVAAVLEEDPPKRRKKMPVKITPPDLEGFFNQTETQAPQGEATNGHKPSFEPPSPRDPGGKVSINVAIKHLPYWRSLACEAIKRLNKPPILFRYANTVVRIARGDDGGICLQTVTPEILRHHSADWAHWHKDEITLALPPLELVKDLLAKSDLPLPILHRVVTVPVFTADGSLLLDPGYDEASGIIYDPAFKVEPIPERVSDEDISKATDLLLQDLLVDFPFASDADRHNAIAALVTPFVRELIDGPTPLLLAEASLPRSGKGLLIESILQICFGGQEGYEMLTYSPEEKEMSKRITAALVAGKGGILIDNIKHTIDSGDLCSALTATHHSGRILGFSKLANVRISCLWTATANNPTMSQEVAGRVVSIRLVPDTDRPEERTDFKHKNLPKWVSENRPQLVRAILVLCKAWLQQGRPEMKSRTRPILGRYESFIEVVGGILENAGFGSFMSNRATFTERADTERSARAALCHLWFESSEFPKVANLMDGREVTQSAKASEIWDKVGINVEGLEIDPRYKDKRTGFGYYLKASTDVVPGYSGPKNNADKAPHVEARYKIIRSTKKVAGSNTYQVERLEYFEGKRKADEAPANQVAEGV